MDGFEWNKIIGAILATLLLLFVLNEAASIVFHKEEPKELAYKLDLEKEAADSGQEAKPEKVDFGRLLATADASAGENVAKRCLQCHTFEKGGAAKTGPNLWDILGTEIAARDGFKYSKAMEGLDGNWTYERLYEFIGAPKRFLPGTTMSFAGLRRQVERINLIAYLRTRSDNPPPLPEPLPEEKAEQADAGTVPEEGAADAEAADAGEAAATEEDAASGEGAPAAQETTPNGGVPMAGEESPAGEDTAAEDEDTSTPEAASGNGGR